MPLVPRGQFAKFLCLLLRLLCEKDGGHVFMQLDLITLREYIIMNTFFVILSLKCLLVHHRLLSR